MKFLYSFFLLVFLSAFFISPLPTLADTDPCDNSSIAGKTNAQLQADLLACEAEAARLQVILDTTKKNTASYATEVAKLTAKINAAKATISAKNLAISKLNSNIVEKQSQINTLEGKISADSESVAELLRKTSEIDSFSLAEAILSDKDLSRFFADVDAYSTTRASLLAVVDNLRGLKSQTEVQKTALAKQRDAEADAKAIIEANKKRVEVSQAEQKTLLTQSQNQQNAYSKLVADKRAKADAIRTALFGLRDSVAIPFSLALQYAQTASQKTGVRPALILGILQQESSLGADVGSCVITDLNSGQTRGVTGRYTGVLFSNGIHPIRDLPVLQALLPALGRDPLSTKVSCPVPNVPGYGGAMGPAQFIPSTWSQMQNMIASALGKTTPDPWNPADAIMAAALHLRDAGAVSGSDTSERTAACRYYSGKTCYRTVYNSRTGKYETVANVGLTYGNSVMKYATKYQADIDLLQDN